MPTSKIEVLERESKTPTVVLVNGFLGAGKTTLLLKAAQLLREEGLQVALIVNDQGDELVDTRWLQANGMAAAEVTRGCFCCRFSDFAKKTEDLLKLLPDVVFAEPVGSCTDLAATVLRPLREFYGGKLRVAPLTVLVEPRRAAELLRPGADTAMRYLFDKQIAEADTVWFTKGDIEKEGPELGGLSVHRLSARTGEGVREWLGHVLSGAASSTRSLDIDYDLYAQAEARLGWLNWTGEIRTSSPMSIKELATLCLANLESALTVSSIDIAHLKLFVSSESHFLKAGICRNVAIPSFEGALDAPPTTLHKIVINLRAASGPIQLSELVDRAIAALPGQVVPLHRESFSPSAPKPEHRIPAGNSALDLGKR